MDTRLETIKALLSDLSPEEISELSKDISALSKNNIHKNIVALVESHKEYVGKCYILKGYSSHNDMLAGKEPDVNKYFKIISERATNEYRMTALTFPEKPEYTFRPHLHKMYFPGDGFCGKIALKGIDVEDVGFFCNDIHCGGKIIDRFEEISLEEYNVAFDKYCEQLKELEFTING